MTDVLCGVRWGVHACWFDNDYHLVGVDCECACTNDPDSWPGHDNPSAGWPFNGPATDFTVLSDPTYGPQAQLNYQYAVRFGPA